MTIQHPVGFSGVSSAGASLADRAGEVAAIALVHAPEVDRQGRFPEEAVAALRSHRLLGAGIPIELGGEGASTGALAEICYALGQSCASTAMIFAMHQTKVACLVRHGETPAIATYLRRVADGQLLLASSTTEGMGGGNVRVSAGAVEPDGDAVTLLREATVISYGAQADGLVTTARRSPEAGPGDQVLCALLRDDYTLEPLSGWETLGMRGTCSAGFRLRARFSPDQVITIPYSEVHSRSMTPVAHILWSSAWAGIAAASVGKAQAFIRTAMRGAGGQSPPGARHYGRAASGLRQIRALIASAIARFEAATDPSELDALDAQTELTMLKVEVSDLAVDTVGHALRATGLAGYREDGPFTIGRHMRDILSSPVMIHNERIAGNLASAVTLSPLPETIRG